MSYSEQYAYLCLHHVAPLIPHRAHKAKDIDDVFSFNLLELAQECDEGASATNTSTAEKMGSSKRKAL